MPRPIGLLSIVGFFGLLAVANAQTAPAPTAFDGTYRPVSWTKANAMYTDKTGRTAPCPDRRPGPLHIANGEVRYTTGSGYKLRGTVGPQGQLVRGLVAPGNAGNAGAQSVNLYTDGYDFVWQKESVK